MKRNRILDRMFGHMVLRISADDPETAYYHKTKEKEAKRELDKSMYGEPEVKIQDIA